MNILDTLKVLTSFEQIIDEVPDIFVFPKRVNGSLNLLMVMSLKTKTWNNNYYVIDRKV